MIPEEVEKRMYLAASKFVTGESASHRLQHYGYFEGQKAEYLRAQSEIEEWKTMFKVTTEKLQDQLQKQSELLDEMAEALKIWVPTWAMQTVSTNDSFLDRSINVLQKYSKSKEA